MEPSYAALQLAECCVRSGRLQSVSIFLHDATRQEQEGIIQQLFMKHPLVKSLGLLDGDGQMRGLAGFMMTNASLPSQAAGRAAAGAAGQQADGSCGQWMTVVNNAHKAARRPQMNTAHIGLVTASVKGVEYQQLRTTDLLVFGVGHDSVVWSSVNCGGRTVFLEDNDWWMQNISATYPFLEVAKVSYRGRMGLSSEFFAKPWLMNLPQSVLDTCWDTILVDAPQG